MVKDYGGIILAFDVGGTKTAAAAFSVRNGRLGLVRQARFENSLYGGAVEVIKKFFSSIPAPSRKRVAAASVAVAAPVKNCKARLTNLGWSIDAAAVRKETGIRRVELLNDVEALAFSIASLDEKDFFPLNGAHAEVDANAAVIAAGTGLGEAIIFKNSGSVCVSASEGGHADFAPDGAIETGLMFYLSERFGGHVSVERVVSGQGIKNIYDFLSSRGGGSANVEKRMKSAPPAAAITNEALRRGGNRLCKEAISIFISALGREAGNLALKTMPRGGVYIGGGIPPKILKELKKGAFMKAFLSKGRMEGLMGEFPVKVVVNENAPLYGAANYMMAALAKERGAAKRGRAACR